MKVTMDDVLTLIERVSDSNLTKFQFEDEDFAISMASSKKRKKIKEIELNRQEVEENQESKKQQYSFDIKTTKKEGKEEKNRETEEASSSSDLEEKKMIYSPLVGTFYVAKEEGAEPFVKVGDKIKKGQVIGIVEAMKLMNEVESEYDGIVSEILVENEEMVEYNQPLISIVVS